MRSVRSCSSRSGGALMLVPAEASEGGHCVLPLTTIPPNCLLQIAECFLRNSPRSSGVGTGEYGDVYFGLLPKTCKHLNRPPLSTRATLHARPWSEVDREARQISCPKQAT